MKFAIIIILYFIIIITDYRKIIKEKNKKITIIYTFFLLFCFSISILKSLDVNIPSPSLVIQNIIESCI